MVENSKEFKICMKKSSQYLFQLAQLSKHMNKLLFPQPSPDMMAFTTDSESEVGDMNNVKVQLVHYIETIIPFKPKKVRQSEHSTKPY